MAGRDAAQTRLPDQRRRTIVTAMIKPLAVVVGAAVSLTLALSFPALARTAGPDCDAVQRAAQAEIAAACPCGDAAAHADHVRCVTKKLRELKIGRAHV